MAREELPFSFSATDICQVPLISEGAWWDSEMGILTGAWAGAREVPGTGQECNTRQGRSQGLLFPGGNLNSHSGTLDTHLYQTHNTTTTALPISQRETESVGNFFIY